RDTEHRFLDVIGKREREILEVADNLMDVFHDTGNRLVLMHDAVDAETPNSGTAQRRQQHPSHRVSECVAETALERLQPELGDVRIVFTLARFDELRANQPAE